MFRTLIKRSHRSIGAGIAGAIASHSMKKYFKKGGRRASARTRMRTRFRKPSYAQTRKKRMSRRRKRGYVMKKRSIRKAFKKGNCMRFTARRSEQVSLEFDMLVASSGDTATKYKADTKWFGNSKQIKQRMENFRHHWLKSLSFKFHNFKIRTLMRTVTTEGSPPQEYTTEQLIEPSFVNIRYRWDKWNDGINPGHMVGHDDRIEEVMKTKCITSCKDKFWGIYRPKGGRAVMQGPATGDTSWREWISRMNCKNFDEEGPPHLDYWFAVEATLPDQFFKPDPPVVRTAKMFIDFDATFYSKWFCSERKIAHS